MLIAGRLAVLIACAVAAGALLVLATAPTHLRSSGDPPDPQPLAGLAPLALVAFILLGGGTALTGAGMLDAGAASSFVAFAGIAILGVMGVLVVRAALRVLRAPTADDAAVDVSPALLVLAWAGAALALTSWLLAIGALGLALLSGVRLERRAP